MNSIKCKNCGLKNFSTDMECRRCGYSFLQSARKRRDSKPRRFSVWSLLMITLFAGLLYYFYSGVQKSIEEVNASDAKRVAAQPTPRPGEQGLSRTDYDRQKSDTYANSVKNSSSLAAHQQHINDTEKIAQQVSNSQSGK